MDTNRWTRFGFGWRSVYLFGGVINRMRNAKDASAGKAIRDAIDKENRDEPK